MTSEALASEKAVLNCTSKRRAALSARARVDFEAIQGRAARVAAAGVMKSTTSPMSPDCVVFFTTPQDAVNDLLDSTVMDPNRVVVRGSLARLVRRCISRGVSIRNALMGALSAAARAA